MMKKKTFAYIFIIIYKYERYDATKNLSLDNQIKIAFFFIFHKKNTFLGTFISIKHTFWDTKLTEITE